MSQVTTNSRKQLRRNNFDAPGTRKQLRRNNFDASWQSPALAAHYPSNSNVRPS